MKRLLSILLAGFCTLAVSCGKDEAPEAPSVEIASSDIVFTAIGGEGSIVVKSEGAITAESDQTWCTTSVNENKISVTVDVSSSMLVRSASIKITQKGVIKNMIVSQSGIKLDIGTGLASFSTAGGDVVYKIISVGPEYIFTIPAADTWLRAVKNGEGLKISVDPNSGAARESTITVKLGDIEKPITIKQAGV